MLKREEVTQTLTVGFSLLWELIVKFQKRVVNLTESKAVCRRTGTDVDMTLKPRLLRNVLEKGHLRSTESTLIATIMLSRLGLVTRIDRSRLLMLNKSWSHHLDQNLRYCSS